MESVIARLARWMVVFALMSAYWPFDQARASIPPQGSRVESPKGSQDVIPSESPRVPARLEAWRAPAIMSFKKALYTARFRWMNGAFRFEIGTRHQRPQDVGKSRFVAVISKEGARMATCERQLKGETPFNTHALLLRCSGKMFDPASGYVRFEFGPYPSVPSLMVWTGPRKVGQLVSLESEGRSVSVARAE